jgi:hypothetical protein
MSSSSEESVSSEEVEDDANVMNNLWMISDVDVMNDLLRIRSNDPDMTEFVFCGRRRFNENMTHEDWEQLGIDIANNSHLTRVFADGIFGAVDAEMISFLFRGLLRSSSIKILYMDEWFRRRWSKGYVSIRTEC